MSQRAILIVGGSDTGRAPVAAALLRRIARERELPWAISSAGVVGHDGELAQPEARDVAAHMGLTIADHQARSIDDSLVAASDLLVGIDSGTARVLRLRFPDALGRIAGLGELAGRARDIPDPFRMQLGAWISYTRELEQLLRAAVPAIVARLTPAAPPAEAPVTPAEAPATPAEAPAVVPPARAAALQQIAGLLQVVASNPAIIDWAAARASIEAELPAASTPAGPGDLASAYVALLRAALSLTATPPRAAQVAALRQALRALDAPVGAEALGQLSLQLGGWAALS